MKKSLPVALMLVMGVAIGVLSSFVSSHSPSTEAESQDSTHVMSEAATIWFLIENKNQIMELMRNQEQLQDLQLLY